MQNNETAPPIQRFAEICRRNQLKITPQRMAIYRELMQSRQHPTADMMFQKIRAEFPNISFDTVNRTLLTFAKIGMVEVVEVFGGAKRFDPDLSVHHHLHCTVCGKIIDVEDNRYVVDIEIPDAITQHFTVTGWRVVFKGACHTCSE